MEIYEDLKKMLLNLIIIQFFGFFCFLVVVVNLFINNLMVKMVIKWSLNFVPVFLVILVVVIQWVLVVVLS